VTRPCDEAPPWSRGVTRSSMCPHALLSTVLLTKQTANQHGFFSSSRCGTHHCRRRLCSLSVACWSCGSFVRSRSGATSSGLAVRLLGVGGGRFVVCDAVAIASGACRRIHKGTGQHRFPHHHRHDGSDGLDGSLGFPKRVRVKAPTGAQGDKRDLFITQLSVAAES